MKITKKDIEDIALKSQFTLTESETDQFTEDINNLLKYFDKLNELDTANIKPTAFLYPSNNIVREDEVKPSHPRESLLSNAPEIHEGHIKVPKVLE